MVFKRFYLFNLHNDNIEENVDSKNTNTSNDLHRDGKDEDTTKANNDKTSANKIEAENDKRELVKDDSDVVKMADTEKVRGTPGKSDPTAGPATRALATDKEEPAKTQTSVSPRLMTIESSGFYQFIFFLFPFFFLGLPLGFGVLAGVSGAVRSLMSSVVSSSILTIVGCFCTVFTVSTLFSC